MVILRVSVKGKLKGSENFIKKKSVGATENLLMAATISEGKTTIKNAACEPEISDLSQLFIKYRC